MKINLHFRVILAFTISLLSFQDSNAQNRIGIGTTTPAYNLHVVGDGLFTNGLNSYAGSAAQGVYATGPTGVYATGTNYGVYASGTNLGLYATGPTGIWATGTTYGIYASGPIGVYATGPAGVYAIGTDTYGLHATGPTGIYATGTTYGLFATATSYGIYGAGNTMGIYGSTPGATDALQPTRAGVYGHNDNYGAGVFGHCFNGPGILGTSTNYYAGYFVGNVLAAGGTFIPSDRKLKFNISDFSSAMDIINKLQPKTYEYRQDGIYKLMNLPVGNHYGLISENVEQVLPFLVKDTRFETQMALGDQEYQQKKLSPKNIPDTASSQKASVLTAIQANETINFKAVNYTELIPIMIKAMQEQQQHIQQLTQQLEEVKNIIINLAPDKVKAIGKLN